MSISTQPGASVTARVAGFGPGLGASVHVQVLKPDATTFLARTATGVTEAPASSGIYWVTFTAPTTVGSYEIVWDNDSGQFTSEDLVVTTSSLAAVNATLNANALTSVQNALAWLGRNRATGDPAADDIFRLTIAINSVSSAIERYTGRQFYPTTGITKTFSYEGGGFCRLANTEARNIVSVTMGGSALVLSTGVGDGSWGPYPRNMTREGTYTYIKLRDFFKVYAHESQFANVLNERDVVVVADWGMTSVPADAELACLIAVSDSYRNPESEQQRGQGEFQVVEAERTADVPLPQGSIDLLDQFIISPIG